MSSFSPIADKNNYDFIQLRDFLLELKASPPKALGGPLPLGAQ